MTNSPESKQPPATSARISINLNMHAVAALEALTKSQGFNKTDTINRALQVYAFIQEELDAGNDIATVGPDGEIMKVCIL